MKNMGLDDLVVVAPRTPVGASAQHMAAHAKDLLEGRRTVPSLDAALADVTLAIGTVGRDGVPRQRLETPRDLAPEIVEHASHGRVALVFGPEDHGLSNSDLDQCQRLACIPTAGSYASLNLAQAVLICAYEVQLAAGVDHATKRGVASRRREEREAEVRPASGASREAMLAQLETSLRDVGFLSKQNPAHIMRDLRALFGRAGLSERDVKVWRGIARQVAWAASKITSGRGGS